MSGPTRNEAIRAQRLARRWTQQIAADAVAQAVAAATGSEPPIGIDATWVSRLERGILRWPNTEYRAALRAVYGATTDAELGLYGARHSDEVKPRENTPQQVSTALTRLSEPVVPDTQPWQLMDALTRSNISSDTMALMERSVFASAARYPSTSPTQLLPIVLGQIDRLRTALLYSQSLRTLRQCVQLTGIVAGLAGNLYLDLGDVPQAASYFEIGQVAGREAGDDALTAWVLTTQSIGPFFSGHPEQTIGLLDHAAHLIAGTGNRRREAWINAMAARAYAAGGSDALALESLERSTACLAEADDPSGIDFFDAARLDGISGSCHLRLRDTATSAQLLQTAIERRAPSDAKGRALLVFDLAECKIVEGEIEEACHLAASALEIASDSIVRPIADRAKAIQNDLSPWHGLGSVATLAERVRETPAILPAQRG